MFSRKKAVENVDPSKLEGRQTKIPVKGVQGKVKRAGPGKRAAFGDLTNATKDKNVVIEGKKKVAVKTTAKAGAVTLKANKSKDVKKAVSKNANVCSSQESSDHIPQCSSAVDLTSSQESIADTEPFEPEIVDVKLDSDNDLNVESPEAEAEACELVTFDRENYDDIFNVGRYAQDIFDYYKRRERMFPIPAYMNDSKHHINPGMRSILVDWMVEVQENFEMNHETLYLAVKLTDLFLSIVNVEKETLQLVGAVAIFIAAKFDERFPPLIEDFTFVCDNAFDRHEFLEMEMVLLRTIGFDLGIPISYRFLRRYAKVALVSMRTLTLARYILELSLMEYSLVTELDSKVAAAALFMAMKMTQEGEWAGDVVRSSGYPLDSIKDIVKRLNKMLQKQPIAQLDTIHSKYSHKVFHEVAKIDVMPTDLLLS